MTYNEYTNNINSITKENRIKWNDIYKRYKNEISNLCINNIKWFDKLTESQQQAIKSLSFKMFEHYLTEEYIANHYEVFNNNTAGDEKYKKYKELEDNNIFLASGSSSTFKALEKRGLIKYIEDGGKWIDKVTPLFNLDFSKIKL
jgi:hypothetical protein